MKFDQRERIYDPGFSYVENPVIFFEKDKPIRGIPAGGINVTIEGRNFDVIQEPHMYVLFNGSKYISVSILCNYLLFIRITKAIMSTFEKNDIRYIQTALQYFK